MQYYLLIIGIALLGVGLRLGIQRFRFLLGSRKTYGTLSNWKEVRGIGEEDVNYYAEVTFEDTFGAQHTVLSTTGLSWKPKTPIGKSLAVRFDPSDPDKACLDTAVNLWAPAIAFLLLGAAALFVFFHPDAQHR